MMGKLLQFFKEEEGASAVEYGILVALIAAAIISVVAALGGKISSSFQKVNAQLEQGGCKM
jgi:pilus assembly protein Flp/PilA